MASSRNSRLHDRPASAPALVVDVRCLQDENYRERGVGRHSLGLLQHARQYSRFAAGHRIIGITDRALPPLTEAIAALLDQQQDTGYVADMRGCWFVQLSPMTHDPLVTARLASSPDCLKASVVYDFIPFDFPAIYLAGPARRIDYHVQLAWLSRYDLFMPISRTSAERLQGLLSVDAADVTVTGAPLDPGFEGVADAAHDHGADGRSPGGADGRSPGGTDERTDERTDGGTSGGADGGPDGGASGGHVLVIGGGDWRKNVECPVRAHAGCAAMVEAGVPIVVTGRYSPDQVAALQRLHREHGGRPGQLRVPGHVTEAELLRLYREACCIVTASRAEGFSLPVVEAMAVAVPSVASRIAAHQELVSDDALLFDPDDDAALSAILSRALQPAWREAVVAQQGEVWPRFRTAEVARLFWSAMQDRADAMAGQAALSLPEPPLPEPPFPEPGAAGAQAPSSPGWRSPRVVTERRPRVALLSPVPPDRSGVADYTAACCEALGRRVDLHVFTETRDPLPIANTTISPLSALPLLSSEFDRVVGVMGNSHFHQRIFELLMRYGGACICHDARLLGFYRVLLGEQRARSVAARELGRPLRPGELERWLGDESFLEATFFADLADVASPLIFHSQPSVDLVRERFGKEAALLPFSIYRPLPEAMLAPDQKAAARARTGVPPGEPLLVTFGFVQPMKGPEECVWALEMLHARGVPAHLHFVGEVASGANSVEALARSLGLGRHVVFHGTYVEEDTYRDYLLGADAAIQLRAYGLGGLSGGLLDCVAAGLPCVANEGLAQALQAPEYVARIPDRLSPVLLALAIEDLLKANRPPRWQAARETFQAGHNFDVYARLLCEALGLPATQAA